MGSPSPLHIPVPALGVGLLLSAAGHVKGVAFPYWKWVKKWPSSGMFPVSGQGVSVFSCKALGRGTDAGRVFTFWGRAREAV